MTDSTSAARPQAMAALRALLGGRTIAYHASLARAFRSVSAAILFAQLLYWQERGGSDPEGWIWKTRDDLEQETALTRYEQEGARKVLVRAGVLEEKLRGVPARMHFRIGAAQLARMADLLAVQLGENQPTGWREIHQPAGEKATNRLGEKPPTTTKSTQQITQGKYTRGRYAVCPTCGARPCLCEAAAEE